MHYKWRENVEMPGVCIRLHIHLISLPAWTAAIYSASVVERATTFWSLEDQETAPVPILTPYLLKVMWPDRELNPSSPRSIPGALTTELYG